MSKSDFVGVYVYMYVLYKTSSYTHICMYVLMCTKPQLAEKSPTTVYIPITILQLESRMQTLYLYPKTTLFSLVV